MLFHAEAQLQKRHPGSGLDHTTSNQKADRQTSLGLAAGSRKSERDADYLTSVNGITSRRASASMSAK
jgi:hypothetical protein